MANSNVAYFNHAGASLMSPAVLDTVVAHLQLESRIGGYAAAMQQQPALDQVYARAAQLLNCDTDEVALTDSHSRGWRDVLSCLHFSQGDRILVARSEWGGNYAALAHKAQRSGASVDIIPSTATGEVCLDALAHMLDERVRLVSLTWLPANGGLIQPAAKVGALTRAAGIPFFLDAAQAVGQLPVDVRALECDVLTTPGRKWLRGPRGTGLLYVRRAFLSALTPPVVDHFTAPFAQGRYTLRQDARRFETSEAGIAARLGLGQALEEALTQGLENIQHRVFAKSQAIRQALAHIPNVQLRDIGVAQSGLVSFTFDHSTSKVAQARLNAQGVEVALNGLAFTPLDLQARGLTDIIRASAHTTTTDADIDRLIHAVSETAANT
ncbi:aminotransferase class V-fold PLP-dependent enzyme [Limnohabitans sp.]|uniref:aminotransferase class V-fold PLP-dependent enzyme n=1 Tax=Limnohabitans sp. TaxID=1907725 RepID=UPI00286ED29C|nr:aminotransferase class V-fold PLP-dependent enzyme [Limnohabitans sp.]